MSESDPLGTTPGLSDDAADTMFGQGASQDGAAVGSADRAADEARTGGDTGSGALADPGDLMTGGGTAPSTDDGEAVGAADRDADVERSS